ncbi:ParA family protein [Legionella sp. W05-934-2]|jgi:chromosome partitioning protein|uniref:ParA family protein n=1 Tax=Legionella sp. W05-934-2 TaxID=1198649 RepID=UPI003461A3C0
MGFVIAVSQAKGGSAKTTTTVNLAGALKELGYRVVVADMDKDKPDAVTWARNGPYIDFVVPLYDEKPLEPIERLKSKYDFVLLDTPPNYMPAAFKAIMLSDLVMLPCSPSFLDQHNLSDAISVPQMAQKPFKIVGVRVQKRQNISEKLIRELKKTGYAFEAFITLKTALAESAFQGKWVGDYAPNSESHDEFKELARELVKMFGFEIGKKDASKANKGQSNGQDNSTSSGPDKDLQKASNEKQSTSPAQNDHQADYRERI